MAEQPWKPSHATERIRALARNSQFDITLSQHAREQMDERGLILGDVLFVLKNGFVYRDPVPSTRPTFYRYRVESLSPNSGSRKVGVVAIPDEARVHAKVITVMWIDEP